MHLRLTAAMALRALNTEELRYEIVARLPVRSRWLLHETPWDWDFSRATRSLEPLSDEDAQTLIEVLLMIGANCSSLANNSSHSTAERVPL